MLYSDSFIHSTNYLLNVSYIPHTVLKTEGRAVDKITALVELAFR